MSKSPKHGGPDTELRGLMVKCFAMTTESKAFMTTPHNPAIASYYQQTFHRTGGGYGFFHAAIRV